jgi:hypothetical protein
MHLTRPMLADREPNMPDGGGGAPYAAAQRYPPAYRFRPPTRRRATARRPDRGHQMLGSGIRASPHGGNMACGAVPRALPLPVRSAPKHSHVGPVLNQRRLAHPHLRIMARNTRRYTVRWCVTDARWYGHRRRPNE